MHFEPQTFDEYCRRLLCLIEQFNSEQVFKYEDVVKDPQTQMQNIATSLDLPFDETFEDVFGIFKVTGDSGRSADVIGERSSIAPEEIVKESLQSEQYEKVMSLKLFS